MKQRTLRVALLGWVVLLIPGLLGTAAPAGAQEQPGRLQQISGQLRSGETDAFLLRALQAGDRLAVTMGAGSGNLDPLLGIVANDIPLETRMAQYRAEVQRLATDSDEVAVNLESLRDRTFLAWDDDGGDGYAAALEFVVPAPGDYVLIAGASLSAFGRVTAGTYELQLGLNAPVAPGSSVQPSGAPIAEALLSPLGVTASVEASSGALTAEAPVANVRLVEFNAGETLYAFVEATSGNLAPALVLRDFAGKPLEARNLGGAAPRASLVYTLTEDVSGFSLAVRAAELPDGTTSAGDYRLLLGVNAPEVVSGQATPTGSPVAAAPLTVAAGIVIDRISAVDSANETYTVLGSLRLDWTDPRLTFSPDSCNCAVKLYSEAEFERFLADVRSRWPDFTFFNQLGNRSIRSRAAAIWPDGRGQYIENFSATFQADFDFRRYPFDVQSFPIYLDLLYPTTVYTLVDLPGYSGIDPNHGEDEFIVGEPSTAISEVARTAADQPVSRLTFGFDAPRHLNYYALQVFLPITLIVLISWFTFFLRDYTKRIEAAAANILLFIAFNFTLADNYPRLGYITFIDAVMAVTFVINVLVLLYNVNMKRLENQGQAARVERIDRVLDWIYPLSYVVLIGLVALLFL